MGMSALMVAVESTKALASSPECAAQTGSGSGTDDDCLPPSFTAAVALTTSAILCGVVVIKVGLFVYCRRVQRVRGYATLEAYCDDHRNDALANAVSVAMFCLAQFYCPDGRVESAEGSVCPAVQLWWVDPAAALVLSLFIFVNWVESGREQL